MNAPAYAITGHYRSLREMAAANRERGLEWFGPGDGQPAPVVISTLVRGRYFAQEQQLRGGGCEFAVAVASCSGRIEEVETFDSAAEALAYLDRLETKVRDH